MGQNLTKLCCCEESDIKLITVPKQSQVDRNIYTLRELSEEDLPETEYDNDNLNETVQTLNEIKINKSITIRRRYGQPSEEYVILDELGEGCYGVVVKVEHKITKNIRALKIINKLNLEKNFKKSILYDEIKILKDIDHPNIIKIYEFFEDDENYYMVTEYCPEGDLATHIQKMECFNETIVKILMFQILSAVFYLHSRNIIHGDLKLENILIETLTLKTIKSFRSSITYDLDKMRENNSNANSNRNKHHKKTIDAKNNTDSNIKNANKFILDNNNNNKRGEDLFQENFINKSANKNLKREFSFSDLTNKEEIANKDIDNGRNHYEKIIFNDLSKTNTIENDNNLINENNKFNQLHNFDLNSITDENENENLNKNEENKKNYHESLTIKHEIMINPSLNLDELKNSTESLFIFNKKSSADLLNQRKLLFMKFNKEQKAAKTISTKNNFFQSKNNLKKNNNSITEEVESWEKSKINTERNSEKMNWNAFYNNADKKDYVPVSVEKIINKNSNRVIFTEEEICCDKDNLSSDNFFSEKIIMNRANGAQAPKIESDKNANFVNNSKLNRGENKFKKVKINIPNLNLNLIKVENNNTKYASKLDNNLYNNRSINFNSENDPLRKADTIEELEKHLRINFNNKNKDIISERNANVNLNSKRTLNNSNLDYSASNQFETINSDSNTMSISIEQNFSTIDQNQKELNNFLFPKEKEKENTSKKNLNNNYNNNYNNNSYINMNLTIDGFNQLENFSNFEIKLIDFGCSKIFKKGNKKFKDIIGTLFYIAPEVIKNNYNEKCDLWSCGVIMYFLLVGFPPFFAMSDTEVLQQILSGDYTFDFSEFDGVSDCAKDLIKKLLEINPKKRLSAKEALEHEFFYEISSYRLNEHNIDFSVLQNLKKSKIDQKFQQAVVSYLVYNFAKKDEIVNLRKIFKTIDIDQDGRISKEELLLAMKKFDSLEVTEKDIQEMLDAIDSDKSGFLEYEEFITATINKKALLTDENLKSAFYLFDQDKNGTISTEEIKNILIGKARNIPEKVVNDLFKQINSGDAKGKRVNGEINFEEFKRIIYQVVGDE
jgi:serine/threonine protein kinase